MLGVSKDSPEYMQSSFTQADIGRVYWLKEKFKQLWPLVIPIIILARKKKEHDKIISNELLSNYLSPDISDHTNEVAGKLSSNVTDFLANVWCVFCLDDGNQLCLYGCLQWHRQAGVDFLEGGWQQSSQEHRCHLSDLVAQKQSLCVYLLNRWVRNDLTF